MNGRDVLGPVRPQCRRDDRVLQRLLLSDQDWQDLEHLTPPAVHLAPAAVASQEARFSGRLGHKRLKFGSLVLDVEVTSENEDLEPNI